MTTDPRTNIHRHAIPAAARIKLRLATRYELDAMRAEDEHRLEEAERLTAQADRLRREAAERIEETAQPSRNAIIEEPTHCPQCGSDDLGVYAATPEREDEADLVGCERCAWEAPLTYEGQLARVEAHGWDAL